MNSYFLKLKKIFGEFSFIEKIVFVIFSALFVGSLLSLLYIGIDSFRKDAPGRGGTLSEGVVGYPSFVNPILSISDSGKDLSHLLYSGLMAIDEKGNVVPDLAESYTVSPDGLTYTFVIREKAVFHDGQPITADDVVFTVEKVKDPAIKSPLAPNWQGVSVQALDSRTVQMSLKSPYAPFIENTTLGILPKHVWKDADIDQFTFSPYNFEPIGSGPYKVSKVKRNSSGVLEYYKLSAFSKYAPGRENISTIYVYFFKDEEALVKGIEKGTVDSAAGISSAAATTLSKEGYRVETFPLLRTFGVFFNQNQASVFTDKAVRDALDTVTDRDAIITAILQGYGTAEHSPVPEALLDRAYATSSIEAAKAILDKDGWDMNADGIMEKDKKTLSFSLTTSDNPDLSKSAELLKEQWKQIGADVSIITVPSGDLSNTVIRPRKYDALLFGEIVERGNDFYPFWHSSERKDPGLNIALYTNIKADDLLDTLRVATSTEKRTATLSSFADIIESDIPAVFLYSPDFIYVLPKDLKGVEISALEMAHDRWSVIFASYLKAKRVWK